MRHLCFDEKYENLKLLFYLVSHLEILTSKPRICSVIHIILPRNHRVTMSQSNHGTWTIWAKKMKWEREREEKNKMKSRNKTFWTLWKYISIFISNLRFSVPLNIIKRLRLHTICFVHTIFFPRPTNNSQNRKHSYKMKSFCFVSFAASFHSMAIFFVFYDFLFAIKDRLHEKFSELNFRVCHCCCYGCRHRMEMIKSFISMKISTQLLVLLSIPKICRRDYTIHDILLHFFMCYVNIF